MNDIKNQILTLDEERYTLLDELNKITDDKKCSDKEYEIKFKEVEPKIDKNAEHIVELLKTYSDYKTLNGTYILDFEFIMEQLSRIGQCPCLLNDDNGHWAVSGDGFQTVVTGEPKDVETQFVIMAEEWKNTPREALHFYLTSNDELEDDTCYDPPYYKENNDDICYDPPLTETK